MCDERSDFVDAHIVPRSFYPERGRGREALIVMTMNKNIRNGRSRIGIYDKYLVCEGCEKKFDPFDDYAAKLLLVNRERHKVIENHGDLVGYLIDTFDYKKLKLFGLSLLWRSAFTSRIEFSNVKLGPFQGILTQLLKNEDPECPEVFSCQLTRFSDVKDWQSGFLSPFREKYEGINFYRFLLGSYALYVKVDRRPTPKFMSPFIMRPNAPLILDSREFRGGPEYRVFYRTANMIRE